MCYRQRGSDGGGSELGQLPPPRDIAARSAAQSPTAPTAPTRSTGHARVPRGSVAAPVRLERRGRSNCPRCSSGRRLFRCSGDTLEAQVGVSPPGTSDGSYARTGPIGIAEARRERHGVASRDSRPCWARRKGCHRLLRRRSCKKTGSCGGSGGRSALLGVGGSLPRRLACSGGLALALGLLGVSGLC